MLTTTEQPEEIPEDPRWVSPPKPIPKLSRWKLEWVASHQDNYTTINISILSTGTQLNIEVDKLVTMGLRQLHMKPRVPLDPLSEVLLHYKGSTITKDLKRTMCTLLKFPILERYYMTRFNWSPSQYQKIDWEIFTLVYRRQTDKNLKWRNKFYMQKLPVRQRILSRESIYDE